MVKYYLLLFTLFVCLQLNAQNQDTLNCVETFKYYEDLLSDKVIFIWDTAPALKECTNKYLELVKNDVKQLNMESIAISVIIDSIGIPRCFKFYHEIDNDIKQTLLDNLKKIRFTSARQKGKAVESIYTFKI